MRKPIFLLILALVAAAGLRAQVTLAPTVVSSGGGYGEGNNITLSWTLGELAVTTLTGNDLILTQGFQQPLLTGVGIPAYEFAGSISVYPNPVGDELMIRFGLEKPGDFLLEIQDVTGRLIRQELHPHIRPGDMVKLTVSEFSSGIYFLKVSSPDRQQVKVVSLRKL